MALRSMSFISCIALTGVAGLFTSSALAGGECCESAGKAKVVAAAAEKGECSGEAVAVAVANEGECSGEAKATTVAAAGECSGEAKVVNAAAAGECSGEAKVVNAGAAGECSTATKATMVAAAGECSGEAKVVNAANAGECGANSECANEGAEVIAVGDSVECEACEAVHTKMVTVNSECPGSGQPVTEGVTAQFAGFTVGFCCEDCQAKFNGMSDDEKYEKVAEMASTVNTECPGSGMAVSDEQVVLYNGFAVGFCCGDCKKEFKTANDAKRAATLAKYVKPVNTECPGSGMEVSGETFAASNGVLVGFCCEDCQAKFVGADAEKQRHMTMKLISDSAGGHSEECKAAYAKKQAQS